MRLTILIALILTGCAAPQRPARKKPAAPPPRGLTRAQVTELTATHFTRSDEALSVTEQAKLAEARVLFRKALDDLASARYERGMQRLRRLKGLLIVSLNRVDLSREKQTIERLSRRARTWEEDRKREQQDRAIQRAQHGY